MGIRARVVGRFREVAAAGRRARARAVTSFLRRRFGDMDERDALAEVSRMPVVGRAAARALLSRLEADGAIARPLALAEELGNRRAMERLAQQARLLADGVAIAPRAARRFEPKPRRVLYHVHQGLPHHSTGYSIRTHWLVRAVRAAGWDVSVHTRLGYPIDRWDYLGDRDVATEVEVDGVPYVLTPDRAHGIGALDLEAYVAAAADALVRRAEALRPSVIHAASNWQVGLAAVEAARRLGLPSIYEVRGLWHQTVAAQRPAYLDSEHYRMVERLEVSAAQAADHVFAITGAVKDVLVGHGVPEGKISILPNAIDPAELTAVPRDEALARQLGLDGAPVVGYVGTLKDFEGLDLLLQAVAALPAHERPRLLVVGDGPAEDDLRALARRLGLTAVFTGRVPHASVPAYYSLIDLLAFPRKRLRVCETVSPLKPFEAMALGVPIIVSDVAALTEIVRDGETGLVHHAGDAASLAAALSRLVADPALRRRLGDAGRAWVTTHHTWDRVSSRLLAHYTEVIG